MINYNRVLLLTTAMFGLAAQVTGQTAGPSPLPGCHKPDNVWFSNLTGTEVPGSNPTQVKCAITYNLCGKHSTVESQPVLNQATACNGFAAKVKGMFPTTGYCCDCDEGQACENVGRALRELNRSQGISPSAAAYTALQQTVMPLVAAAGAAISQSGCRNDEASRLLQEAMKDLGALDLTSPTADANEHLLIEAIVDLRQFEEKECHVGAPPPPAPTPSACPPNESGRITTPEADKAYKMLQDVLERYVHETEKGWSEEYKKAAEDALNHVQSADCLPGEVNQAVDSYNRDKYSGAQTTHECDTACHAYGNWFARLVNGPDSHFNQDTFFKLCMIACE